MTYTPLDLVESYLRRFVSYPSEHALVALVAERRRTVLFDEIDAVYGTMKRQEANGALVAFMNAG